MATSPTSSSIRLCVNTQTPLVRFRLGHLDLMARYGGLGEAVALEELAEGEDYEFTPGGVTAMIHPLLVRMMELGVLEGARWVSLGPDAPAEVAAQGIRLHHIRLTPQDLVRYSRFKEGIWNELHGLGALDFRGIDYEAYARYNWLSAEFMLDLLDQVDLFWIHDFQQLLTGSMIGPSAPAVLRWHIPLRLEGISHRLRTLILKGIEGFDALIVSTKRELQYLLNAGYRGRAHQMYPHIDPEGWGPPSPAQTDALRGRFSLSGEDRIVVVVGRMDPVKSQDLAIQAVARLRREFPSIKLVLVGDGSFSGSARGGLGLPKAQNWRARLEALVRDLGLEEHIVFTRYLRHEDLTALYAMADAVAVPSRVEGFNLTGIEGWMYQKPCVVSLGAGSSELVQNEVNGFTFDPSDPQGLADALGRLLRAPEAAARMGENGSKTARLCFLENKLDPLRMVFEEALEHYHREKAPAATAHRSPKTEVQDDPALGTPR